ncbi:nipped-B-like protein isoform X2 [Gigantopelta aegis]|uniref:nipped-B-like protein isoform X2 n=1 Tax=Gigantopelta aegis TaxID=1735272 RepID=UPI001B889300|nr:nipped-B-like protein isoform X2 [Gigantopelta aegis]
MNGETPSVPITTLAGISSLTDLLPQLPLPTPLPQTMHNKSLLYSQKIADDASKILATRDDKLSQQLAQALQQTSTDHIELKDNLASDSIEGDIPALLKSVLAKDPNVFSIGKVCDGILPRAATHGNKQHGHTIPQPLSQSLPHSSHQQKCISNQLHQPSSQTHSNTPQHTSSHYQQEFTSFSQKQYPTSATINGDCYLSDGMLLSESQSQRSNSREQSKLAATSPAQATSAEKCAREQVTQQPSSSVPHHSQSESAKLHRSNRRSRRHSNSMFILDDQTGATMEMDRSETPPPKTKSSVTSDTPRTKQKKSEATKKAGGLVVLLEPLDAATLKTIHATGGTVKNVSEVDSTKRRNMVRDADGGLRFNLVRSEKERGFSARLSRHRRGERTDDRHRSSKRKRCSVSSEEDEIVEMEIPEEDEETYAARKRKKEKRQKRSAYVHLSVDELLDSPTFNKLTRCMDYVFDSADEVNFAKIDINDDEQECPTETLIAKGTLADICGEAAKLKSMGVLNQIPPDRLVKLLTILQWNIRDGVRLTPNVTQGEDDIEEEKLWRQLTMERIMRSMDACLSAIHVMTCRDMPKQVYLEDVIERMILFGKFQLHNTVYPEFDPVYRINAKDKDGYHGSLKQKRARAVTVKHKSTISLYNKLCDLVSSLAELLEIQELTDTIILQVSTLGVSTFFVENISELQLSAMKLVTTIFSRYEKHRQLILEDIFASLARLPSSKRNLRNYRLNSEESIQMVTALALQLIQCVVKLPTQSENENKQAEEQDKEKEKDKDKKSKKGSASGDVVIVTSYETAMRTGYNFLSVFLKKCTTKGEEDYRPMFENFVQDLLSTVNKPEWPASELLLSLLGRILVQQFSNKSTDMSLRVASLEYLGIVAARLRKDALSSQLNPDVIEDIAHKVNEDEEEEDEGNKKKKETMDTTQSLQEAMLTYLSYNAQNDPSLLFSRQFYIAQWFRDASVEAEKQTAHEADFDETEAEMTTEVMQNVEKRTSFLMSQVAISNKPFSNIRPSPSKLDYESACLVARYLSSKRPFAQSFDIYLTQILKVLSETSVAVRTKAMKCLTAVVEADPGILARSDMKRGVHGRFLDQSTSVREAAIELLGKFILIRPELIPQYYDMLSERILDTGISVRKRVIKIFKDICIEHPDFNKIPEMCVKMIRRVNDEEGIKKLVNEVFMLMWFSPISTREKDSAKLVQKVFNITDVVAACKDTGYEFFEQMLDNLLKKDENGHCNKSATLACQQIVDCLVENVLTIDEKSGQMPEEKSANNRLVSCLSTLYLFSKSKPELLVKYGTTLQPYLDIKCSTQGDYLVLHYIARILEAVVPLMDHPSELFLAQLEEDMMKLILKHGMMVLQSCISCLGAVINNVSHNYKLVKDCFQKFFGVLTKLMADHTEDPHNPTLRARRPMLLRAMYTVGLLCREFDFDHKDMGETKVCVKDRVFDVLVYFMHHEDEDVKHITLTAIGFLVTHHYEFMLGKTLKDMYYSYLGDKDAPVKLRCQVLKNLQCYLTDEEVRMSKSDADWKKHAKQEDLKEMGDVQSGMASTVMQIYLKQVLESFFHEQSQVRMAALSVIILILKQGLVHPVQCVPYLISMGSDPEPAIRVKSDQHLEEIEKKYPGFTHMKALQGLKTSFRLQEVLHARQKEDGPIRGMRYQDDGACQSLNSFLYTVLRVNRQHRRGLLTSLLNLFDDSARISLKEQLYIADNLAFFNYQTQDEPLFAIHQIDIIVSVTGSNLLQSFKEALNPRKSPSPSMNGNVENGILYNGDSLLEEPMEQPDEPDKPEQPNRSTEPEEEKPQDESAPKPPAPTTSQKVEDDDDDDPDSLLKKLPEDITALKEVLKLSQGCVLLLVLKQHLKDLYGFTDSKIYKYSPSESTKAYDKQVSRKINAKFNPQHTIEVIMGEKTQVTDEDEKRQKLVDDYFEFRDLMMSIDPMEEDDSGDEKSSGRGTPVPGSGRTADGAPVEVGEDGKPIHPEAGDGTAVSGDSTVTPVPTSAYSYAYTMPQRVHKPHSERKKRSYTPHKTPKSTSVSKTPTTKKKEKKKRRRKRYGSDSDDVDSDEDPDFIL